MKRLLITLAIIALFLAPAVCGGTSSAKFPGTTAQTSDYGPDWNNPDYIKADDESYAYTTLGMSGDYSWSELLIATNFGFAIPSTATISGIEVSLWIAADVSNCVTIDAIGLCYGGSSVGYGYNDSYYYWPNWWVSKTFGSSSNLWGWSYASPSYVNSSSFGVQIGLQNPSCIAYAPTGYIDYVKITVHYTDGWTGKVISVTNPAKIIGKAKDAVKKVLGIE